MAAVEDGMPSVASMSQVKPPREFKFVGAFSRKRRRRTAPAPKATATARPAAPDADRSEANRDARGPTPSTTTQHDGRPEPVGGAASTGEDVVDASGILSPPADAHLGHAPDWASYGGGFMNPFFDPGTTCALPFDQLGHIPFYLGPDIPMTQLDGSPSTEDTSQNVPAEAPQQQADGDEVARDQSNYAGASAHQTLNEIVLPWLDDSNNISHTITQLLTRYDQEFCVMPLTHDFEANPFRFDAETCRGSQLLWHSILALSYKHLHRETGAHSSEAKMHKTKALQMLRDMEGATQDTALEATFLDAVLILMTLDCATSAHGPWVWYLKRAHKMMRASEALHVQKTPRMQARIEMLVWWDVTLALTSRQGCVLSESTIVSLFNPAGTPNPTFYSVSGCPEALFRHMVRLGSYAREYELAATMTCVKFDMAPVLEEEKGIREWTDRQYDDVYGQRSSGHLLEGYSFADMMHHEDLHHCAEAWRYALLLYIERVFKWQRDQLPPPILSFLARRTLNHVSSCGRNTMVQKQLLLPVFLAGCETTDEHLRQEAKLYCSWWSDRTRYDMFSTSIGLFEEVWASDRPSWWGSVLDQKSRLNTNPSTARQYLFG